MEKFSFCWEKNFLVLWILKVLQYYVEKYFIFIKMKGLEVKLLGKRKKILTNMSYLLQRSLFYRFSFKKKGILNVSILHKFNVWHIITKRNVRRRAKNISMRKKDKMSHYVVMNDKNVKINFSLIFNRSSWSKKWLFAWFVIFLWFDICYLWKDCFGRT